MVLLQFQRKRKKKRRQFETNLDDSWCKPVLQSIIATLSPQLCKNFACNSGNEEDFGAGEKEIVVSESERTIEVLDRAKEDEHHSDRRCDVIHVEKINKSQRNGVAVSKEHVPHNITAHSTTNQHMVGIISELLQNLRNPSQTSAKSITMQPRRNVHHQIDNLAVKPVEDDRVENDSEVEIINAVKDKQSPQFDKQSNTRTFADVLQGESSVPTQQSSSVIKVSSEILQKRIDFNKFSIIGRIVLAKGEEPWNLSKLKEKLSSIWTIQSPWRLISLGKGFYQIWLSSAEVKLVVWSRGAVNLKPGILRLQNYNIGFDPLKEKTTHTQAWFRLYHLPWGLWDPIIISDIVRRIGMPLKFDKATVDGDFGHFARVLVDVDLSKQIRTSVLLECGQEVYDVRIIPEKLPEFCKACSRIGHFSMDCWTLQIGKDKPKSNPIDTSKFKGKEMRTGVDEENKDANIQDSSMELEDMVENDSVRSPRNVEKFPNINSILVNAQLIDRSGKGKGVMLEEDNVKRNEDNLLKHCSVREQVARLEAIDSVIVLQDAQVNEEFGNLTAGNVRKKCGDSMEDEEIHSEETWIEVERKRIKKVSSGKQRPRTRSQSNFQ